MSKQLNLGPQITTEPVKLFATTAEELKPYYVTVEESRCHDIANVKKPCRFCGGQVRISYELLKRFKVLRETFGAAIHWSSGYRCKAKQQYLYDNATPQERAKGLVAKPGYSDHERGDAADLKKPDKFKTALEWGQYILQVLKGDIRIGCKSYKSFAHIDTKHVTHKGVAKGIRW